MPEDAPSTRVDRGRVYQTMSTRTCACHLTSWFCANKDRTHGLGRCAKRLELWKLSLLPCPRCPRCDWPKQPSRCRLVRRASPATLLWMALGVIKRVTRTKTAALLQQSELQICVSGLPSEANRLCLQPQTQHHQGHYQLYRQEIGISDVADHRAQRLCNTFLQHLFHDG